MMPKFHRYLVDGDEVWDGGTRCGSWRGYVISWFGFELHLRVPC
jgi:hypothetical protein